MSDFPPDVIDHLAGVAQGSRLDAMRDLRLQARENAQNSFLSLFATTETTEMSAVERFAVAGFVALLHDDATVADFYASHLDAPTAAAVKDAARAGASTGPYGAYPSPALAAENTTGTVLAASALVALGPRLATALAHAHMLVFRPREANATSLQALLDAGWSTTGIVTLSQLVSFLAFQLRVVAGLRVLAAA